MIAKVSGQKFGKRQNLPNKRFPDPSHLGGDGRHNGNGTSSDWRNDPRVGSFRDLVRKRIWKILIVDANRQWTLQQATGFVSFLEKQLFANAASMEDYTNQDTLRHRLEILVQRKMVDVSCFQPNSSLPTCMTMPTLQSAHASYSNELDSPFNHLNADRTEDKPLMSNNTDKSGCQMYERVNSLNGVTELLSSASTPCNGISSEGLLEFGYYSGVPGMDPSLSMGKMQGASEKVLSPDMNSTITTCSSLDEFCENGESGIGPVLHQTDYQFSSGASLSHNLLKQHLALDDGSNQNLHAMDLSYAVDEKSGIYNSDLHIPENVSLPTSRILHGTDFGMMDATLGNLLESKSPLLEQNQQKLYQPQKLYESLTTGNPYYINAGLADSSTQLPLSLEHKILLGYVDHKNSVNPTGNSMVSFINHLHSKFCNPRSCMCDYYYALLEHFDRCHCTNCSFCDPIRGQAITGELPQKHFAGNHNLVCDSENILPPAKRLKPTSYFSENTLPVLKPQKKFNPSPHTSSGNGIVSILSSLIVQTSDLEKLPPLQHWPESPQSFNSETSVMNCKVLNSHKTFVQVRPDAANTCSKLIVESMPTPLEEIFVGFKSRNKSELTSVCDMANSVEDDPNQLVFNSLPVPTDEHGTYSKQEVLQAIPDHEKGKLEGEHELNVPKFEHEKKKNSLNSRRSGVSLIEYLSTDQIAQHISSLQQLIGQTMKREDKLIDIANENQCQLCTSDKLLFAPQPIYCSSCGARIKSGVNYYCTPKDSRVQHCFCTSCHKLCRGGNITLFGISIPKGKLEKRKNSEEIEEPWVQCDKCLKWQHQICALFNAKSDVEGNAEYVCPLCCLKERESGKCLPLSKDLGLSAKDLPSTKLGDYIEQRLFRSLKQERVARAEVIGKTADEVPGADDLVVREVLSVNKLLKVKEHFSEFHGGKYPVEFPYTSKVVLLFQKIDGVDVCLFAMYVQEFGSECSSPNQRCVYISYLDSVKYFRPDTRTAAGEALRTFVYHEILIGYLEYCKKRGFVTCYLWACPPLKGEDYILYCHPGIQKTPKSDKLRQWYHLMIRKAAKENIVVNCTNLYDKFFVPTGQSNSKITAARLPYFDGDFWSGAAENFIKNFEQQTGQFSGKVKKTVTKRTLKAMGHTDSSVGATKDILLMQKLSQVIFPNKEDFIIAYLQFVCTNCHGEILSGWRWCCNECKNFQLCERCHDAEHGPNGEEHIVNFKEKHLLSKVMVGDVPSNTEVQDVTVENWLFENRHTLLGFCQKNHYQFDTLRRAKHSSMMILHHLHNPTVPPSGGTCNICHLDVDTNERDICSSCEEKAGSLQVQKLTKCTPAVADQGTECKDEPKSLMEMGLLNALVHASQCQITKGRSCSYPCCIQIKKLFRHTGNCNIRVVGGCQPCKKVWILLKSHARNCRQTDCHVPRCKDLRKHAEMLALQSETQWQGTFAGLVGPKMPDD